MGSRRENKSRQHQGERRKVCSVLEQAQENAIWKMPTGERAGLGISILSMAAVQSSFPAKS